MPAGRANRPTPRSAMKATMNLPNVVSAMVPTSPTITENAQKMASGRLANFSG